MQFNFWVFARSPFGTPGVVSLYFGRLLGLLGTPLGALGFPWGDLVRHVKPHVTPFVATSVHFWAPGSAKDESWGRFATLEAPFPADLQHVRQI